GMRQRRQELVVYRTLGAGKRLLRTTLWCEFALLGVVSGVACATDWIPVMQNNLLHAEGLTIRSDYALLVDNISFSVGR
ncbi:hypothetical protein HZD82_27655, partial [Pantoea agglomerans]|uniref:hypothetical protein n=1 Tax=Enterobacter agglomerans TaxID=549 RepID=UPI001A8CCD28